jgi:photosystem II protein
VTRAAKDQKDISDVGLRTPKYDESAKEVSPLTPAFTRRREVFVGRLAMLGFAASVLGELVTGRGALGQIGIYTGLDQFWVKAIVFGTVLFNFIAATNPASPTWSAENQADKNKRRNAKPEGMGVFGLEGFKFGFSKPNELIVGRIAMLGFASELIGEINTGGKGPLGQLGLPLNLPVNAELAGWGFAIWVGFALLAALSTGNWGEVEGDEDIY